jgi:excisionase family DNA binding protein
MDKLYNVKEATEILKISRTTLYRLIWQGLLKPVKIGNKTLFAGEDLDTLIENLKNERT